MVVKPTMLWSVGGKFKMSERFVRLSRHTYAWLGGEAHNAVRVRKEEISR
jgi:hypothetical protein